MARNGNGCIVSPMTNISEGLILVSSDMRPGIKAPNEKAGADADSAVTETGARGVGARRRPKARAQEDGHVGQVLRTVYQRTVDEDIPSEMLDLLSKLG
jgi:hypothetical protein